MSFSTASGCGDSKQMICVPLAEAIPALGMSCSDLQDKMRVGHIQLEKMRCENPLLHTARVFAFFIANSVPFVTSLRALLFRLADQKVGRSTLNQAENERK